MKKLLIAMLAVAGAAQSCAAFAGVPAETGRWKGSAEIIVTWCKQKELPIEIEIFPDGRVTGKIGDAIVENGRFSETSGMLVWLGNSRYVISAGLKGPIVKAEGITRKSIELFVNLSDERLTGGFHTSGGKFGGKDSMMLSGSGLNLLRQPKENRQ